ncbi:phosphomethylpyrimidine synthase [candidate division WOR-1 bacterium RIFCSPHIGHO2_01_FULL_53_15]|uniref:Phosphomethylpyrimidine synthase n=1 Tax=candidate division WOR-1 bacterium RIFCSPHIGHO2_01_FULL_53_15 TaxID=1802564 RepID=A0A1F4PYW4_UNCSA|nr:MAG: phosphomethylpyrimidine synthase [candidate division WOR-1 bacterium RIFCSPHIGHO2_01_FULL_53_15]OGC10705.1 MAG: phosphomethylpyrimidine synthase [candidate division WOR-1 bacterium RIFCSPHIGHO2_02_FULL_53_26]
MTRRLIVTPHNPRHKGVRSVSIGQGLSTKVNANIGTSADFPDVEEELKKLEAAIEAGADTIMDLSTGGEISAIRKTILSACPLPLGTVPIYQAMVEKRMTAEGMFEVVAEQAQDGVDFMTIHCGVTFESIGRLKKQPRIMDVVSRGGAALVKWIIDNKAENPFYLQYDRLLEIALKYDITLSLGDGMRPGSIIDAGDQAQIQELIILGDLTKRAWEAGVQVIIEGPGHVPYDQIEAQIKMQKEVCKGAPFYVLGPLPTDVAPGYDHITAAIGGTLAASAGADFLCYVTPTEHLGLPTPEDVREGVIASRIAAHCADIVKGIKGARQWDNEMSKARKALDWERQINLAIDPKKAREIHERRKSSCDDVCSMCGEFCAYKVSSEALTKS